MKDAFPQNTANTKKRNLTIRFCVAAIMVTSLLVLAMTAGAYLQMRAQGLQANFDSVIDTVEQQVFPSLSAADFTVSDGVFTQQQGSVMRLPEVLAAGVYDARGVSVWQSDAAGALSQKERDSLAELVGSERRAEIFDPHVPRLSSFADFFGNSAQPISGLMVLRSDTGQALGVMKLVRRYESTLNGAERSALQVFWYILAGNMLLFIALFYNFWRGLQTIESQEKKLSQQISRLSNLLSINKSMQMSMKTATSRAVEMNEQFLRRVGSDLHDGPAQSLGYAILRLNRVAEDEEARALSHEFHVVREALDSSLEEIRGISSGLVLPELEQMTLVEALQKVVSRHSMNADTEVSEYYKDLPEQIPLPIKITAYRFVQEGLNNAHRHGQAERCRITAHVKDDVLHLSLKDNGMGFRKSQLNTEGGHLGLMGLKDRIESLGGRFSINSELGVGTAIKVSIAITDEAIPI